MLNWFRETAKWKLYVSFVYLHLSKIIRARKTWVCTSNKLNRVIFSRQSSFLFISYKYFKPHLIYFSHNLEYLNQEGCEERVYKTYSISIYINVVYQIRYIWSRSIILHNSDQDQQQKSLNWDTTWWFGFTSSLLKIFMIAFLLLFLHKINQIQGVMN